MKTSAQFALYIYNKWLALMKKKKDRDKVLKWTVLRYIQIYHEHVMHRKPDYEISL